jgi:hypothetical protein
VNRIPVYYGRHDQVPIVIAMNPHRHRQFVLLGYFVVALTVGIPPAGLSAQSWERLAPILPAPVPFSLNSHDVIQAVNMILSEPALLRVDYDGSRASVPVHSARSVWIDFDPDAFENHQNRYDVELNGTLIDWDHLFIEYAGNMVNLRLLFTYRYRIE